MITTSTSKANNNTAEIALIAVGAALMLLLLLLLLVLVIRRRNKQRKPAPSSRESNTEFDATLTMLNSLSLADDKPRRVSHSPAWVSSPEFWVCAYCVSLHDP